MKKRIIVHIPFQIHDDQPSGTNIRPGNMCRAFENIGYEVDYVNGTADERKLKIKEIKKNILNGVHYEFMYTECSTEPTLLTESHHLPLHPFLDFGFFSFCRKNGIKIGLFYRDIYWNFPFYGENIPAWKVWVAKFFYRYDLKQYNKYLEVLYLPSEQVLPHIPLKMKAKVEELPPGAGFAEEMKSGVETNLPEKGNSINILYVGGISTLYRLSILFEAVKNRPEIGLTVCCRKGEWEAAKPEYEHLMSENIKVVHKSGDELIALYAKAHIGSIFLEPNEYRNFSVPIKLFEYIKFSKPVLATNHTSVGVFVAKYDIGWSLNYELGPLLSLFDNLIANPSELTAKITNVRKNIQENTWEARAKKVVKDLSHQ